MCNSLLTYCSFNIEQDIASSKCDSEGELALPVHIYCICACLYVWTTRCLCVCAVVGEVRSVFAVKVVGGGSGKLIDGKRMFCVRDGKRKTKTHT